MTLFSRFAASSIFILAAGMASAADTIELDDPSTVVTVMQFTLKPGASREELI